MKRNRTRSVAGFDPGCECRRYLDCCKKLASDIARSKSVVAAQMREQQERAAEGEGRGFHWTSGPEFP